MNMHYEFSKTPPNGGVSTIFSGLCGAVLALGLQEDYAFGSSKGTGRATGKPAACGVVCRELANIVAFDGEDVALTVNTCDEFGAVFDGSHTRKVAKVHFVPLTCLRGEFDDVGVDDGDRDVLRTAMNSMTGNAGIVEDEGSTAS